ncbi:DUF881 domain-containing protein [Pseudoneobacillus sp. C159]
MSIKKNGGFTIIALVIGFMIAIQFQSVQEPVVRDTRDEWQLREDLLKEKELQSKLIKEIQSNEEKLSMYETERKHGKEQVLRETLSELEEGAGLTAITGPGIILTVQPDFAEIVLGQPVASVSPEVLQRLLNELNMYEALHISIDGNRIINTTVIRDINNETTINGQPIKKLPFDIVIVTDSMSSAEKLSNRMKVSNSVEDFFIDNLRVTVSKPIPEVTVPAYSDKINVRYMEPIQADKGGS